MKITRPGCSKPFEIQWVKRCGIEFIPHPGLMVDLVSGSNPKLRKRIVQDGLVLFPKVGKSTNTLDAISRHFKVYEDDSYLEMYVKILPKTEEVFRVEAGGSAIEYQKMIQKASKFTLKSIPYQFDQGIGWVVIDGPYRDGGTIQLGGAPGRLRLHIRCEENKFEHKEDDIFVNPTLKFEGYANSGTEKYQSVSLMFQRVCKKGTFGIGRKGAPAGHWETRRAGPIMWVIFFIWMIISIPFVLVIWTFKMIWKFLVIGFYWVLIPFLILMVLNLLCTSYPVNSLGFFKNIMARLKGGNSSSQGSKMGSNESEKQVLVDDGMELDTVIGDEDAGGPVVVEKSKHSEGYGTLTDVGDD
jgi:hypothetical protein